MCAPAYAHDADMATSPEQARVYQMYSEWNRPKGNFSGIEHRKVSCCNKMDCGVVQETRRNAEGLLEIKVCTDAEVCDDPPWRVVNPTIMEENQKDPIESPDGRAHACVVGGQVVCYVGGGGS